MDKNMIILIAESRLEELNIAGYANPIEEIKEIYKLLIEIAKLTPTTE